MLRYADESKKTCGQEKIVPDIWYLYFFTELTSILSGRQTLLLLLVRVPAPIDGVRFKPGILRCKILLFKDAAETPALLS